MGLEADHAIRSRGDATIGWVAVSPDMYRRYTENDKLAEVLKNKKCPECVCETKSYDELSIAGGFVIGLVTTLAIVKFSK